MLQKIKQYEKAIKSFNRAKKYSLISDNIMFEAASQTNIGTCNFEKIIKQKIPKAEKHEKIRKYVIPRHAEAEELYNKESIDILSLIYTNLAVSYGFISDKENTKKYLNKHFSLLSKNKMQNTAAAYLSLFAVSVFNWHLPSIIKSIFGIFTALKDVVINILKGLFTYNGFSDLTDLIEDIRLDICNTDRSKKILKVLLAK